MQHEPKVSLGGQVVWWGLNSEFDHEVIVTEFDKLGLKAYAPKKRTRDSALELALTRIAKTLNNRGQEFLVVSKQPRDRGFEIVVADKQQPKNAYLRAAEVGWDTTSTPPQPVVDPYTACTTQQQVDEYYWAAIGDVFGSSMGTSLVSIATRLLGGLCLRPNGGIYWLPQDSVPLWDVVTRTVVNCASRPDRCHFSAMGIKMDEPSVAAIKRMLAEEVMADVERIRREVAEAHEDEGMGAKAVANRVEAARQMLLKVQAYEQHVNEMMPNLTEAIADLQQALIVGNLRAMDTAGV